MREVPRLSGDELIDSPEQWELVSRTEIMRNRVFSMQSDTIRTPDGEELVREFVQHPGAVGIIAVDADDHVILVRQYRHPAGYRLIEPPAGLLDIDDEQPLAAAQRELAEEAQMAAADWRVLVDLFTTPGGVQESARVFLARDLSDAPRPEGFVVEHEEAHMDVVRAPFDEVVAGVLGGRLQSPLLVSGILALATVRAGAGEDSLRAPEAPWPARGQKRKVDAAG
ncbi:NUDIX domain-containing protein [Enemella sp. A6]|uniref:NUDIX domain-containing protein n=1 Tax=Enemella sp. A6 TaxID=3440152 RepID=UPI003EB97607